MDAMIYAFLVNESLSHPQRRDHHPVPAYVPVLLALADSAFESRPPYGVSRNGTIDTTRDRATGPLPTGGDHTHNDRNRRGHESERLAITRPNVSSAPTVGS